MSIKCRTQIEKYVQEIAVWKKTHSLDSECSTSYKVLQTKKILVILCENNQFCRNFKFKKKSLMEPIISKLFPYIENHALHGFMENSFTRV